MKAEIVPLVDVTDGLELERVGSSLRRHCLRADNVDIRDDFPLSYDQYTGSLGSVVHLLRNKREGCEPGKRELFVAFAGGQAVGMSVVQVVDHVPGLDPQWEGFAYPNVGGFVCNPWRGQGIGLLTWRSCLAAVDERFDGRAWTLVRPDNVVSHNSILRAGFKQIGQTAEDAPRNVFTYNGTRHITTSV